ncbi:MAG: hypothetical protein B7Z27_04270 [Sphingobacteriia bacterium 32-37-4]|nr:MAG: hypothetical protein B7Z27_04270 [Sphingobacteriia bacterium 32-37-4]
MKKFCTSILVLVVLLFVQSVIAQTTTSTLAKGKLIIVGGGSMPDTMYQLFAKSIGGKDQSVVVIPTPAFIKAIQNAKGIYFSGGDQSRIADAFLGTQVHAAMLALFQNGGVFMGTSAGATIMGSLLVGGDARKDLTKPFDFPAALNLFKNTAIDQHVLARNRQFDLIPVIEQHPLLLGIAIDESTAIVVEGNQFSVLGKSYAMVYDAQNWDEQKKQWGRVLKPFLMIAQPQRYDIEKRKVIRN